ncbi:hypothetical protein TNCV_1345511 [Trichonephila clavipes]|nr:hypothetical protein TNCV_1345511 [Trichonephila clavipes]
MPSCHSVDDLELAVQDLWAHLPQDNIRNEFGKMEQGATDLLGLPFEEEAGQAHWQQKRKVIFGESKEVGYEFLKEGKFS